MTLSQTLPTLQRVAAGEQPAVRVFVERYSAAVWSLARKYCGSAEAEDAVQDIFVELWEKADRFDPEKASEYTFVTMIARRRLIDRLRRKGRAVQMVPLTETVEPAQTQVDMLEQDDTVRLAKQALKELPDPQQQVIRHSIYDGLSHSQIAEKLGLPLGTVKTHARRGLMKLRDALRGNPALGSEVSA